MVGRKGGNEGPIRGGGRRRRGRSIYAQPKPRDGRGRGQPGPRNGASDGLNERERAKVAARSGPDPGTTARPYRMSRRCQLDVKFRAVEATTKGRCRLHGGASGSGGPLGKRNSQYRHGERTKAAIAEQRKFSALLKLLRAGMT